MGKEKDKYEKIRTILTKETKGEEVLLVIMSLVAMVVGILIFVGVLSVDGISSLAGEHPKLLAAIFVVVGIIGLLISVYTLSRRNEKEETHQTLCRQIQGQKIPQIPGWSVRHRLYRFCLCWRILVLSECLPAKC